jgi:VWFA-related protein
MRWLKAIGVAAVLVPAFATIAWAQQPATATPPVAPTPTAEPMPTDAQQSGYVLRVRTTEVMLNATVVDQGQRTVDDLQKSDFSVWEDGVPQTIVGFKHEDVPISLGILIDSSGSMYNKVDAVRAAVMELIKASNAADETFIVNFSDELFLDQDFTSEQDKLQEALRRFQPAGGTAIYDAVVAGADHLTQNAKHAKQVLLIVTDGDDHDSSATLESAIRRVQELDGPVVYCIGLLFGSDDMDKNSRRHSQRVLQTLADQTGGIAFFPHDTDNVDELTKQVAQDIRSQYTISYRSTKPYTVEGYRQIHVEAHNRSHGRMTVRTRSGYYPRTEGQEPAAPQNEQNLKGSGQRQR